MGNIVLNLQVFSLSQKYFINIIKKNNNQKQKLQNSEMPMNSIKISKIF